MLMTKPPTFDHVTGATNPQVSNQPFYQSRHDRYKIGQSSKHEKNPNQSVLSNNSAMNFYPHFLQPTRMSDIIGAGSSNGSSNRAPSTRTSLKYSSSQSSAKTVSFYRSGDVYMQAFKVAITKRNFRTFDSLLESLSDRISLPFGVRTISTPRGTHGISRLDEFEDGKSYVCSDKKTVKPLNLSAARHPRPPWFISKPKTRTKAVAQLIRRPDAESYRVPLRLTQVKTPKKIVIVRNGEPNFRHTLLLSRRTPQSFENILDDIGEIFRMRVHKLYSSDGRKVESLQSLFLGPTVYVAGGREAFQPMEYRIKRVAIADEKKDHSSNSDHKTELNKERTPKELKKTKGRWKVSVVTSELAAAATDSHVTITVYGVKGNTGPILLNGDNKATFKSGNEDHFVINVGAIGEIRKVRIAHDNSGAFPEWLCESVTITDVTTGEVLNFPCNRWLSRDEDDGEICREIPAAIGDKPVLPVTTYQVSVSTGNLWNAGTSANIYITLFGELGDSGPRLLQHGGNADMQLKGRTSVYKLEAVSLGVIHRIVVGHDEQKPGDGWFLDRIVVEEERIGVEEWVFTCEKWLDAGEDDGKTIRELYADSDVKLNTHWRNRNETDKTKVDSMWELEKWKFNKGTQIVLISQATGKALRVRSDAAIDGLGDPSLPTSTFEVLRRRANIRVFSNVGQPSFHIALDQNRTLGHGKGGSFCEFYVKVQTDRSVVLESCRYPGQHATVDPSGKTADTRGHPNAPGKIFYVYVKGCFRHNSIILFNTSPTQVLAITSSGDVIGTGRRLEYDMIDISVPTSNREKQFAHFRVVKVAEGVRMFQCEKDHKRFLRIKDGRCDGWGNGDVYCHFKIHKHKLGSYVTLESMKQRGVFIGLDAHGKARPTVDTGDVNNQLYPKVISFGERRKERAEEWKSLEPSFTIPTYDEKSHSDTYRIPSRTKSKQSTNTVISLKKREHTVSGPADGDFRIYVTTGNSGSKESVSLFVYGDKGSSGPITLGKGMDSGVFQNGQTDEFQANLAAVGEIRKIRIGVEEVTSDSEWRLKQVKMKNINSSEIHRFKFNRWLARTKEDGATLRELPIISADGKPMLPILRYHVIVRTSAESARLKVNSNSHSTSPHEIYLCLHGENGDTGRRFLLRKPSEFPEDSINEKPLFAPGQTDKFQLEAVSLGDLTKCVTSCPSLSNSPQNPSPAWLCEEIIVRESEGATHEYVFWCKNKWLGTRKVGAKTQVKMELAEKREIKRNPSDENSFEEGDWKISVTTGSYEDCGTSANVMFYACGSGGTSSGPIFLGSGTKGLFAERTTEKFKVNLAEVKELEKIRLTHDNSGSDPAWFVDRIKLQCLSNDVTHSLDVRKWLSATEDPYQTCVEIPISKPGCEVPPVLRYQVLVYTGGILGSDTDANVFITIYGKNGDTSRRLLVKSLNHDTVFQESQVDIFEVEAVGLGELTKIEIGHDGIGHGNGWFLHKVIIKESALASRDYIFFSNRWLDDGQDDGKIVRVIQAEPTSDVVYALHETTIVDTESKPISNTEFQISVDEQKTSVADIDPEILLLTSSEKSLTPTPDPHNVSSPKLVLSDSNIQSTISAFLTMQQKDEDAASVSSVPRLLRSETPPIILPWRPVTALTRPVTSSTRPVTSDGNRIIELSTVIALTDDEEIDDHVTSEGKYKVIVTTGGQSSTSQCPPDASVSLVIYGEEGKTGDIILKAVHDTDASEEKEFFQPGQADEFQIEVPEIGEIYKIRLTLEHELEWKGWLVDQLVLEAVDSKKIIKFNCKRWLSKTEDDHETVREFAVEKNERDSLPVKTYCISVTTGDRPGASTDANVYVILRGQRGDTGKRRLKPKTHDMLPFQRNKTSSFLLEAVDLGKLTEVVISHDGQGYGAGLFLEKVAVRESESATAEWVFPAHSWLDDHVGDCKTERKLRLLGQFDVTNKAKDLKKAKFRSTDSASKYDVTVVVDEVMTQANSEARLIGTVYGSNGRSVVVSLGDWRPGREKKYYGKADLGGVGEISKLRIELENSHLDLNLFLISVTFENVSKPECYQFNVQRHFRSLSGSTVKELPVLDSKQPYQKLACYLISIKMQLMNEQTPSEGRLELKLSGSNGDSGYRTLFRGMDGLSAKKSADAYVFELEAVDLHELQEVSLKYIPDNDLTDEGGWKIGDIVIKENPIPNHYVGMDALDLGYIASVDREFNPSTDMESQFSLQQCQLEPDMEEQFQDFNNELIKTPVKELATKSEGSWKLVVTSSPYEEASIFNQITLKIFGSLGTSNAIYLSTAEVHDVVSRETDDESQIRTKDLEIGTNLGNLYLLQLIMNKESTAEIHKIKLKDLSTNEEFLCHLTSEDSFNTSEDDVMVYNFPLVKPDHEPMKHHAYEVKVKTGDVPSADTDADVFINIFGSEGSTGPRSLKNLAKDPDDLFLRGHTDSFTVETVDVGEPQKILLSHSSTGGGAGWYPEEVVIEERRENTKSNFIFSCNKWLDDSVDDKLLKREFYLNGTRIIQNDIDVTKSKGNWKCHIISKPDVIKQREADIKFTFCMSDDQSYDSTHHVTDEHHDFDFSFNDHDDINNSGKRFMKLQTEVENGEDTPKKTWPLQEFFMIDEDTGEKLRFVYDCACVWDGSARGHVRELSVVRANQEHQPVFDYYVIFSTNTQSNREFAPSHVYCQLRGKNGVTGWREIVSSSNASGKFRPGRIDVFNIEAVCLGDVVDDVMIRIDDPSQHQWKLDRVKVKRDYYDEEEQIFECNREINQNEVTELSLTKNTFVYPPKPAAKMVKSGPKSNQDEVTYNLTLTWEGLSSLVNHWSSASSDKTVNKDLPTVSVQLFGSKSSSDVMSVDLKKTKEQNGKTISKLEAPVSITSFGDLIKIGLGVLDPALPIEASDLNCVLRKVSVTNKDTDQHYVYKIKHNFFSKSSAQKNEKQTGLNWIELAATRPRQDPTTIAKKCNYVIKLRTADHEDAGTNAHVYVILIGKNGESGKRWMMASLSNDDVTYLSGQTIEFSIESIFLDELNQVIIGHDARDVSSAWYLDNVTVTSSLFPKMHFVFNCNKWLANLQEDTFIERTLTLDHVINDDQ